MDNSKDNFFERVYAVVRKVPKGRVTTYGAIARFLGAAGSARMVGWAMNHSHHLEEFIPAHRVVNRNGYLTGKQHFSTPERMQKLLENEGVEVEEDRVVHFTRLFWDPFYNLEEEP